MLQLLDVAKITMDNGYVSHFHTQG